MKGWQGTIPTWHPFTLRAKCTSTSPIDRRDNGDCERRVGLSMKNIFVGNLGLRTSEEGLRTLFELYGTVQRVKLVTERDTGRSRGFAFIEMSNDAEAEDAITALNGTSVGGRTLKVSESRPRDDRAFRNRSSGDETGIGSNRKFGPLRVRQPQW